MTVRVGGGNLQFACQVPKTRKQTRTHNIEYLWLFYGNKGYTNMSQCYVMCTLPILFLILAAKVGLKLKTLLHTWQPPCSLLYSIVDISLISSAAF